VGGNAAGAHIFARATAKGKRVQANLGAKNHATILPDADKVSGVFVSSHLVVSVSNPS
jgi:malonate-semialdehyde dehydrogenase (acetylating)/methylmalonate-semialdehyde dehydrogenase